MALRPPIALNAASGAERPTAKEFRLMMQALAGVETNDELEGIAFPSTGLKVSDKSGTDDMSVDIAAGGAFLESTEGTSDGCYFVYNDAVVNLAVPAADATNPRKDLVIVHIRDSAESGANDDAQFALVQGTAQAVPVEPDPTAAGYKNYLVLAMIDVPALDTAIGSGQITDRRVASIAWSRPRGQMGYAQATSDQTGITSQTDLTGLTLSPVYVVGRRYRWTVIVEFIPTVADGSVVVALTDSANTQLKRYTKNCSSTTASTTAYLEFRETAASAGATQRKARMSKAGGTGTIGTAGSSASNPHFIACDDVGGVLT